MRMPADSAPSVNLGSAIFVSAPPNPVHISYRWFPRNGGAPLEGPRALLPAALPPGEERVCRLGLTAPSEPGRYTLSFRPDERTAEAWHTSGPHDVPDADEDRFDVDFP